MKHVSGSHQTIRGTHISTPPQYGFPKSVRLLRSSDFRKVYDNGTRHTCPWFAAFCVAGPEGSGISIGFTTPRALGKAVVRNRIRRRIREAVRLELAELSAEWSIVFNPRKRTLECTLPELRAEVKRLFVRCAKKSPTPPGKQSESSSGATNS